MFFSKKNKKKIDNNKNKFTMLYIKNNKKLKKNKN